MAGTIPTMTLDDEMPWRPLFAGRQDFYDDTGFTFTAEAGAHDIMIGNFIYTFQGGPGRPRSQWLGDGIAHNGLIVILPREQRVRGMFDNPFSRSGMNLPEYHAYDELEVERDARSVIWKLGDIQYTCTPPVWHLGGRQGEAEYDLTFRQLPAPVVWSYGTREDAVRSGMGGGYVYLTCDGTLSVAGRRYSIRNGRGVHERLCFSEKFDPIANVAIDKNGFGSGFAIHLLDGDVWVWGLGNYDDPMFFLTVEGKELQFVPSRDGSKVRYQPLDPWHDPRSGLYLPSRWRIELESAEGRLELDAFGNGRAYYPWEFKRGYQIMYWHLGHANGTFTWPDGRTVPIRDQLIQHEIVKNIIVHQETMAGPRIEPSF
jgi:hypothetical protein